MIGQCQLELIKEELWQCTDCGWQWHEEHLGVLPKRRCPARAQPIRRPPDLAAMFAHVLDDPDDTLPVSADDIAFRFEICRRDLCGYYKGNGKGEWCACTKTCQGKATNIELLCVRPEGCPAMYF